MSSRALPSYLWNGNSGFQATDEDDQPGDQIYYLGFIDCLIYLPSQTAGVVKHRGNIIGYFIKYSTLGQARGRVNLVTAYTTLTGIGFAASRTNAKKTPKNEDQRPRLLLSSPECG